MSEIQLKATSVENKPTWEMESSAGILQLKATSVEDKPVRIGDLPIIKTNILENAGQMDKGVVGGYNGAFPLTAASEGGIYLLPSTGKFYVCETAYNGSQISAPNSNFVELSVWKNHDRLNNLIQVFNLEFSAKPQRKNLLEQKIKENDWIKPISIFCSGANIGGGIFSVHGLGIIPLKNSFRIEFDNTSSSVGEIYLTVILCSYKKIQLDGIPIHLI